MYKNSKIFYLHVVKCGYTDHPTHVDWVPLVNVFFIYSQPPQQPRIHVAFEGCWKTLGPFQCIYVEFQSVEGFSFFSKTNKQLVSNIFT